MHVYIYYLIYAGAIYACHVLYSRVESCIGAVFYKGVIARVCVLFSSPEHELLMVSFWNTMMSVVRPFVPSINFR